MTGQDTLMKAAANLPDLLVLTATPEKPMCACWRYLFRALLCRADTACILSFSSAEMKQSAVMVFYVHRKDYHRNVFFLTLELSGRSEGILTASRS